MPASSRPLATTAAFARAFGAEPVRVQEALEAGLTRGALRAALARGLLRAPRHGILALADGVELDGVSDVRSGQSTAEPWEELAQTHVAEVRAALRAVGPGAFATHDSAAIVLGLARPRSRPPDRVTLAHPGVRDFDGPGLRVRGSAIPDHHVTVVDGIPTTDVRRTAVDLARSAPLPSALVPVDAAARTLVAGWASAAGLDLREAVHRLDLRDRARRELAYAVSACIGWRGIRSAREAVAHVEPASESPLESRSRGWFIRAGLCCLEVGVPLRAGRATYWADFCSMEHRVIGEADGWGKYGTGVEEFRRTLTEEKARQTALESEGWRFVRWTSDDSERDVVDRMTAALR